MRLNEELMLKRRNGWPCHTVMSAEELWKHLANAAKQFTGRELGLGNEVLIQVREIEKKFMRVELSVGKSSERGKNKSNIARTTVIPFQNYSQDSMVGLMREVMYLAKEDGAEVRKSDDKWEFVIKLVKE